mmetsp:Transcript_1791/g.3987  ORF Transcript_1791/g.3987 Transcript_1791/m.3987 type:complete len:525 (+) Transcript_1791:230-1804(+)
MTNMTKRKRCEWWSLLRDDIVMGGGTVHSALEFSEGDRILSVNQKVCKGEIMLRIPAKKMITKNRALSRCQPWLEEIIRQPSDGSNNIIWHNSTADLSIAIALASCQSIDNCLYLHSLPDSSSFDALPRRWSDKDMHELLAGTSLLRRIISDKSGAIKDYEMLLERYQQLEIKRTKDNNASWFPSFDKFSDMLAAVTSRAFQIGNTDEDIALVPLLDLGNHNRGKATSKLEKKNVSYHYDAVEWALIVKSTIDIDMGESIRLTYGAKSNAHLLLNYGFCIQRNLEPDGSSNDILEFRIGREDENSDNSRRKIVALRAGPKSYSYGGFVATLEEYLNEMQSTNVVGNGNFSVQGEENKISNDDDFEAFLNECENEDDNDDEEGNDFMDLYGGKSIESEVADENQEASCIEEIEALERFKVDLIKLSKGYRDYKDADISTLLPVKPGSNLSHLYSTILSLSELRTIYFFLRAIEKLQNLIRTSGNTKQSPESCSIDIVTDPEDLELIDTQTDDLANVYMTIRHRGL